VQSKPGKKVQAEALDKAPGRAVVAVAPGNFSCILSLADLPFPGIQCEQHLLEFSDLLWKCSQWFGVAVSSDNWETYVLLFLFLVTLFPNLFVSSSGIGEGWMNVLRKLVGGWSENGRASLCSPFKIMYRVT